MGQNANRRQIITQSRQMCLNVNAIRQSANDLNFIAPLSDGGYEFINKLPAIGGGVSCSDDADDFGAV